MVAIVAATLTQSAHAASFTVTNQDDFATAVGTATTNSEANTIDVHSPDASNLLISAQGATVNFPGSGQPFDLDINDSAWFQVGSATSGPQTLNIGAGTAITITPTTGVSRMQVGVGPDGNEGTVNMTGGSIFVNDATSGDPNWGTLDVGRYAGSVGVFNQSGGSVLTGGALQIGYGGGNGTYNLSGGTQAQGDRVGTHVYIGEDPNAVGLLKITGTGQFTSDESNFVDVGLSGGVGTITQDGVNTTSTFDGDWAAFGSNAEGSTAGTGYYNLNAGTLAINSGSFLFGVGPNAVGKLTQTGGILTSQVNVVFGDTGGGAEGTYEMEGGAATFADGFTIANDIGTTGTVEQTAGTISISGGAITFGGGIGEYDLNGGVLEVGGTNAITGGPNGSFKFGGGTLDVTSNLTTGGLFVSSLSSGQTSTIDTRGYDATWSSPISGSGSLIKAGEGTLTFEAGESYTGSTTVAGGTLEVTPINGITPSASLNLTAAGATFTSAHDQTINNLSGVTGSIVNLTAVAVLSEVSGVDTTFAGGATAVELDKQGSATLTLSGSNNFATEVDVTAGTLKLGTADAISTPNLYVHGATLDLGGSGVQNGVADLANFDSNSTLRITLDSGDKLALSGYNSLVTFADGAKVDLHDGSGGGFNLLHYTIATAPTVHVNGSHSITDDFVFLDAVQQIFVDNGDDAYVKFKKSDTNTLAGAGETPNEKAVGGALDNLDVGDPLFDQIAVLGVPAALTALDSMEGDLHASTKSTLVESATYLSDAVNDHVAQAFAPSGNSGGADLSPVAPGSAGPRSGASLWGQAYGRSISLSDGSGNAGDVDSTQGGVIAGIDAAGGGWLAGLAGGYSSASVDSDAHSASGDVDAYNAVAYAAGDLGAFKVTGGGSYSFDSIDTTRHVILPTPQTLTASYDAKTAQAFGEIGIGVGIFEPFVGGNYINVATDGFAETGGTGGTAALTAASSSEGVAYSTLGVRAQTAPMSGLSLTGMAGWRHAYGDVTPELAASIAGKGFTVDGTPVAKDAFVAEAGVDFKLSSNATFDLSYVGQIGSGVQDQGAKGTATLRF